MEIHGPFDFRFLCEKQSKMNEDQIQPEKLLNPQLDNTHHEEWCTKTIFANTVKQKESNIYHIRHGR